MIVQQKYDMLKVLYFSDILYCPTTGIFLLHFIFLSLSWFCLQFVIWFIIPAVKSATANRTNNTLALIVLIQYVPRLFVIFPLNARIVKTTGVVTKTAWAGAAYNLLLYMLASHVCIIISVFFA